MASIFQGVFVSMVALWSVIKGQETGYATHTFSTLDVQVTIQMDAGDAIIDICGPSDVWFAIGFGGGMMMDVTYAIIVTNDGSIASATEYSLGTHQLGDVKATQEITLADSIFSGDDLCVTLERDAVLNISSYFDFPNAFDISPNHDIIAAKGTFMSLNGHSAHDSTTLWYMSGIAPTASPVIDTTDFDDPSHQRTGTTESGGVISASADSSGICFASDSYVLVYPDYKKKAIKDVNVYDKILTYDDLTDTYFWDELLVKIHFEEGEFLNDVLIDMRQFILSNGERLTMSDNHLLFVGNSGLQRADAVKLGDKLKVFDGTFADVIGIEESVKRYGRNLITYNGNLVINGVAISTFIETVWGESPKWGKWLRTIMKYGYSHDIWRLPLYFGTKAWNEYASVGFKDAVLRFYFEDESKEKESKEANWFKSIFNRK